MTDEILVMNAKGDEIEIEYMKNSKLASHMIKTMPVYRIEEPEVPIKVIYSTKQPPLPNLPPTCSAS